MKSLKNKLLIRITIFKFIPILICSIMTACSGTRYLPAGDKLYTGAEIKLEASDKIKKRNIKKIIKTGIRPEPNNSFLGMRPKLWIYMVAGDPQKSKFRSWMSKRGEAPVLISNIKPGITADIIDAKLFNAGIFNGYTEAVTVEKKHTAKVIYTSYIHKPYTISELVYDIYDGEISKIILADSSKTIIYPGDDYNLGLLKDERTRIDILLKNRGYFYFNPGYIFFQADTSNKDQTVSIKMTLKDSIPQNALTVYRINNVFIDQHYTLSDETTDISKDTIRYEGNVFARNGSEMNIRPKVILESVYLRKGDIYSRKNHSITLNRLMSMGNFKFVQVKFSESDTTVAGFLDVAILMTNMPNHTFRGEMDMVSKSNNYTGPRLNASLLIRNTFNGAELLTLNLAGSYEMQLRGQTKNLYSYSVNPIVELTFPRFLTPFKIIKTNSLYTPKTKLSLSYQYLKRVDFFDLNSFQFVYGYHWKGNIYIEHVLNPVNISYTSLGNQSVEFTNLLDSNEFLKKSYEERFIAGGNYSYVYNEQMFTGKIFQYYLNLTAEAAGTIFSFINIIGGEKPSPENPSEIIGSVYSQFAKSSADGRMYYNFRNKNRIAMRLIIGVGKPFGNSSVLPYSRQFFSGGPNSLRGFQINSVGPGTYFQDSENLGFLQLGGDIKLETNLEYRFTMYRFLKGAFFADAGNVWLQKSNPSELGNPFLLSSFLKEVAVGTGFGIRIDVSFFILRFDFGIPIRKPWLEENNRWVVNKISFGNSAWRRDNLILNIAIGYPF
jgi:outer membrane protein insertion porin family